MKTFTCDIKLVFSGNKNQATNVEEYKQMVMDQFHEQYPDILITEDEIHNIQLAKY